MKSARENIQKSARERKNLPVNFSKKCPWTQKHAREHFWKSEVHGHFWGSRVKKKNTGSKASQARITWAPERANQAN